MIRLLASIRERLRSQTESEITSWLLSGLDPRKHYELLVRNLWSKIGILKGPGRGRDRARREAREESLVKS